MELALTEGHAALLAWCLENDATLPPNADPEGVGKAGDETVAQDYLVDKDEHVWLAVIRGAARAGHAHLTVSLLGKLSRRGRQHLTAASMKEAVLQGGLLSVAQAIQDDPLLWHGEPLKAALRHGRIEVAQWVLRTRAPRGRDTGYLTAAAASASLRLVLLVHDSGYGPDDDTPSAAAASGSVAVVRWVMSQTTVTPDEVGLTAAAHGHVNLIDWMASQSMPLGPAILYRAAQRQTAAVVRSLLARGLPYDPATLVLKACENVRGSDVLALLLDSGLPADPAACRRVAGFGFDDAILHERFGLPLPPSYLAEAVSLGDLRRVRYAVVNGVTATAADLRHALASGRCALLAVMLGVGGEVRRQHLAPATTTLLDEATAGLTEPVPDVVVSYLAELGYELVQPESGSDEEAGDLDTSGSDEMSSDEESSSEPSFSVGSDSDSDSAETFGLSL